MEEVLFHNGNFSPPNSHGGGGSAARLSRVQSRCWADQRVSHTGDPGDWWWCFKNQGVMKWDPFVLGGNQS